MYYVKYNDKELVATFSIEKQVLKTAGTICSSDISIKFIEGIDLPNNDILVTEVYDEQGKLIKATLTGKS